MPSENEFEIDPMGEAPPSPKPIVEWQPTGRSVAARGSSAAVFGVMALGALAAGALAIGALAIGTLAIGRLVLARARIRTLRIDTLIIGRIENRP